MPVERTQTLDMFTSAVQMCSLNGVISSVIYMLSYCTNNRAIYCRFPFIYPKIDDTFVWLLLCLPYWLDASQVYIAFVLFHRVCWLWFTLCGTLPLVSVTYNHARSVFVRYCARHRHQLGRICSAVARITSSFHGALRGYATIYRSFFQIFLHFSQVIFLSLIHI